jgi:hypothetical protein
MTGAVSDMELRVDPDSSPSGEAAVPIILGSAPCPRCEAAVRDGLESCPGCGAAIPMDASEWMPYGAYEPKTKTSTSTSRRENILLLPPLGIIGAGFVVLVLGMAGGTLGVLSEEAGWALMLIVMLLLGGGFGLLLLGLAVYGILWLLERVGKTVGFIVDEEAPDDPVPADPTGPSWQVVFPGCTHLVQLEYPGLQPKSVWCDGSRVPLEWSGKTPDPFTFDDHEASLRLETHVNTAEVVGQIAFLLALSALMGGHGAGGTATSPDRYRWRLVVTP